MISPNDYTVFCEEYYTTKPQHERFGQAFFNKFLRVEGVIEYDNLFNETRVAVAEATIWRHYINKEEYEQTDNVGPTVCCYTCS
jgi:hypothetical protein